MDHWVFVHIMKTAGTSFRRILEDTPDVSFYPTGEELAVNRRRWYLPASELVSRIESGALDLSDRQFLFGHYPASLPERLPGTWRTATFLREPVARTLSMIAHHHYHPGRWGRWKRLFRPNVARYLADEAFVESQIRDYQTKVFALPPTGNVNGPLAIDDAGFEQAKARLFAMDFVGLTEQFGQSIALLETMTGRRFAPQVFVNRSRGYSATEAECARIRALVPRDMELYELARERLRASIAAAA
jgi:hypothetical protein